MDCRRNVSLLYWGSVYAHFRTGSRGDVGRMVQLAFSCGLLPSTRRLFSIQCGKQVRDPAAPRRYDSERVATVYVR
jgi:hypothetical protein